MSILIILLAIFILFGGGGYYGYNRGYYSGAGYGGALGLIVIILLAFYLIGRP
jgi:hypothetical protein